MTFLRAWVLLFALIPLGWMAYEWRRSSRRLAMGLKAGSLILVIIALSEPRLNYNDTKVAVAAVVDTSASVSPKDLEAASDLLNRMEKKRGSNILRVVPFAKATRIPSAQESATGWKLSRTSGEAGRGTNLEVAVRDALASLPSGMIHRVVLVSDGKENLGTVTRATWQAQELGVPIDTVAMAGRPKPSLRVESVSFPAAVFSGERFPIDLVVTAPRKTAATIEISAEGKKLGATNTELQAGENHLRMRSAIMAVGAVDLAGTITAPGLGDTRFEQAVNVTRPKVLLLSQDPAGTESHLVEALNQNQFDVAVQSQTIPPKLDDYQLVVFNNWDMENVALADKARIEKYEQEGGGLLWIAGEHNQYVEKKPGTPEDPLERAFPAKLAPPRTPEGTAVVLIIDKSSSMEGKKMELARLASIGVVENLRPIDFVGVLIFDNSFQWAVPIRKAEDRTLIKRLIAGITPDGGTQIAPALTEAYHKIAALNAVYKHIVLLTDGISEEGDSMGLSREAALNHVTISTVGLGQDVNRAYLDKVATYAKGKSYFLNDPSGLEQILLKDVQEHTGTTAVEKSLKPEIISKAELLDGIGMESAPPLQGYVRFDAKPSGDQILQMDQKNGEKKDPLFIRWQYGLGRAAIFSSDAKSRWASAWVSWPGFDKFWTNVSRDLLPHGTSTEALAAYDDASGDLVVDYHLGRHVDDPAKVPDIFVLGPNGFQKPMKVTKLAAGSYRASIPIGTNEGLFRIRPSQESKAFPEVGYYRQEAELLDFGSNPTLLKQIAAGTSGHYFSSDNANAVDLDRIFDSGGRSVPSSLQLWPGLLALAILLNLAELILRKWRGLVEALRGKPEPGMLISQS